MKLKYGSTTFPLDLPDKRILGVLAPPLQETSVSPIQLVQQALASCDTLFSGFHPSDTVLIITSDITRATGSEIYLPLLVERLNQTGIKDHQIEILIALGIHRKQTETEHRKILGGLYGRIQVTDHECDDPNELTSIGQTSSGTEVWINRRAVEADRLILTGVIGFHYFAGFGGGRKSILPGIASRASCMASHFNVLNPEPGSGKNQFAVTANLDNNPVHQAMDEACALVEPDLILNTILTPDKQIVDVVAGHWQKAHLDGCQRYQKRFSIPLKQHAALVIASSGGLPKDINLIQSHKAMEYACQALEDNGVLILLAECRDGMGNATFFNWFQHKQLPVFEQALRDRYEINGQTAYSLLQKAQRFQIILVSSLPPQQVSKTGLIPATSLEQALTLAQPLLPPDWQAYIIPEAGSVLPTNS
jgi:nickel-dependent lactate racemase